MKENEGYLNVFKTDEYLDTDKMIEYVYENSFIEYDDDIKLKMESIILKNKRKRKLKQINEKVIN